MTLEVGDRVRFSQVTAGTNDTEVTAVGPCTINDHQDELGGPCGQVAVTVTDPQTGQPFSWHEDGFVKLED